MGVLQRQLLVRSSPAAQLNGQSCSSETTSPLVRPPSFPTCHIGTEVAALCPLSIYDGQRGPSLFVRRRRLPSKSLLSDPALAFTSQRTELIQIELVQTGSRQSVLGPRCSSACWTCPPSPSCLSPPLGGSSRSGTVFLTFCVSPLLAHPTVCLLVRGPFILRGTEQSSVDMTSSQGRHVACL